MFVDEDKQNQDADPHSRAGYPRNPNDGVDNIVAEMSGDTDQVSADDENGLVFVELVVEPDGSEYLLVHAGFGWRICYKFLVSFEFLNSDIADSG